MDFTAPPDGLLAERFDRGDYVHHQRGERQFFYSQFGRPSELRRERTLPEQVATVADNKPVAIENVSNCLEKPASKAASILARRAGRRS